MDNIVRQKLAQAQIPGCVIEFEPDEAEQVGAFQDDALTLEDVWASAPDLLEVAP